MENQTQTANQSPGAEVKYHGPQADLLIIHGAVHDEAGPVSTVIPQTPVAHAWLKTIDWTACDAALIETANCGLVVDCAERDGLRVEVIGAQP